MSGAAKRTASVLLAGTIAVLAPGAAPQAVAQQHGGEPGGWRPPPVNNGALPDGHDGKPFQKFTKTTECISTSDDLSDGPLVQDMPWGQQYLRINKVHEIMRANTGSAGTMPDGKPVTVAVIDTGVSRHRWLDVMAGADYVKPEKPGPGLNDCDGHGTMVAGLIAADTPPHIGFKGVAPDARIYSVRQSSDNYDVDDDPKQQPGSDKPKDGKTPGGDSGGGKPTDGEKSQGGSDANGAAPALQGTKQGSGVGNLVSLANAVAFAAGSGKVDVMNISIDNCQAFGQASGPNMAKLHAAIHWAVTEKDVVVVASAGNVGDKCTQNNKPVPRTVVAPPWFDKDVLSVAAINEQGGVAEFSMHGPWVDVAAPGTEILSLDPASGGLANRVIEGDKPVPVQGTSYAAPYVAGLAALVRAKYPDDNAYQVMHRIETTAQHPAAPGGHSQYVGYGVINPVAALTTSVRDIRDAGEKAGPVPAELPEPAERDWTPVVVALTGAGGALVALLITLFTVHTVRRNRARRG